MKFQYSKLVRNCLVFLLCFCVLLPSAAVFAAEETQDDIVKLAITYHSDSENGNMIAEPYYADMLKGCEYKVTSPRIENYVFRDPELAVVSGILDRDTEIKVVYSYDSSNKVDYTINYIGVDSLGQETVLKTETKQALVDTIIPIPFLEFPGYDKKPNQDMNLIVTAGGNAEKNIYYARAGGKHHIIFKTGGSYVEPILAEAGTDISQEIAAITPPVRQGYDFAGWDQTLPTTMPNEDLIVNATWMEGKTTYRVSRWKENRYDNNYTLSSNSIARTGTTGEIVTANGEDKAIGETTQAGNEYYGFDYSHADEVKLEADGTSVLNVYYKREIWTMNFHKLPVDSSGNYTGRENPEIGYSVSGKYQAIYDQDGINRDTVMARYQEAYDNLGLSTHRTMIGFEGDLAVLAFENAGDSGNVEIYPKFTSQTVYPYYITYLEEPLGQETPYREDYSLTDPHAYHNGFAWSYTLDRRGMTWIGGKWRTANTEEELENQEWIPISENMTSNQGQYFRHRGYAFKYTQMMAARQEYALKYQSGNTVLKTQKVHYDDLIDLSYAPISDNPNLIFDGWMTSASGTESENEIRMPDGDMTVYAKWKHKDVTVSFDAQGGNEIPAQTIGYNTKAAEPETPVKAGYEFTSWYLAPDGGDLWSFDLPLEKDLTLYAHWRPITKTAYTVRHIMQGQEVPFFEERIPGGVGDTVIILPLDPEHEHYPPNVYLKADERNKTAVLKVEPQDNIITFTYIEVALKNYTVKYLDKDTNEAVRIAKNVETRNAIVTEIAPDIEDYALIGERIQAKDITFAGPNEIIFYYQSTIMPGSDEGNLIVSKAVTGSAGDTQKDFHFTVTLSDTKNSGTYGDMTFENGVAAFTLKHGESKTASGLPAGISYEVNEAEANQDGYVTTMTGDRGTIAKGQAAEGVFINTKEGGTLPDPEKGDLTVSKTVAGSAGDTQKDFHFTVTLSDTKNSGTYGDMTFENGVAAFTLKHGESKTASGLPAGISYEVNEAEADQDGYMTHGVNTEGVIEKGLAVTAAYTNTKEKAPVDPEIPTDPVEPEKPTDLDDVPQTGDDTPLSLWAALSGVSLLGLVATLLFLRKNRYKPKN